MKTIIAGSRHIADRRVVERALKASGWCEQITVVLSGRARGVDTIGEEWADWKRIPIVPYPARWRDRDGHFNIHAGFDRNEQMAKDADALIAVRDGESNGTRDMIERAEKHGLKVFVQIAL